MTYPQPPWTLQGHAVFAASLLNVQQVRPFIPPELEIINVLPGKTLGGLYFAHYGSGSVLEYSELIVVAGLVSYAGKFGGWVSHIYVDLADSVAGGREIWGLPKELAQFTWETSDRTTSDYEHHLSVSQGDRKLCHLSYNSPRFTWPLRFSADTFSTQSASILIFNSQCESSMNLIHSQLQIATESPFAPLGFSSFWLTVSGKRLSLVVAAPSTQGNCQPLIRSTNPT
jgi:hypothetical protein